MNGFSEFDEVRLAQLLSPIEGRFLSSSWDPPPHPAVGETGTIVNISQSTKLITVEKVDASGFTTWLCEFSPDELEFVRGAIGEDARRAKATIGLVVIFVGIGCSFVIARFAPLGGVLRAKIAMVVMVLTTLAGAWFVRSARK